MLMPIHAGSKYHSCYSLQAPAWAPRRLTRHRAPRQGPPPYFLNTYLGDQVLPSPSNFFGLSPSTAQTNQA